MAKEVWWEVVNMWGGGRQRPWWFPGNNRLAVIAAGGGAAPVVTSYANVGGMGDRTAIITVTKDVASGGAFGNLVNGNKTDNACYFTGGDNTGKFIKFDFGLGKSPVIDESAYFGDRFGGNFGVWQWQGSNNDSDWTNIGSSFTWNCNDVYLTTLSGNKIGYRYYRLLGVSGISSPTPYLNELEFRISGF